MPKIGIAGILFGMFWFMINWQFWRKVSFFNIVRRKFIFSRPIALLGRKEGSIKLSLLRGAIEYSSLSLAMPREEGQDVLLLRVICIIELNRDWGRLTKG